MECGMRMFWLLVVFVVAGECRHINTDPHKSCMFGNTTVADGEVAMSMPEKCVALMCQEGKIVEKMIGAADDTGCCVDAKAMYPPGFTSPHCIPLTCTNGTWVPQNFIDPCCGRCELYGYSHFTTSDTHRYDWHGFCNYTLFTLTHAITQNASTVAIFTEMIRIGSCATIFGHTTFHNDPHTIINITRDADQQVSQQIDINGDTMTIPRNGTHFVKSSDGKHNVVAYWQKDCLVLQGELLITLRYCPLRLDIWTPRFLSGSVNGLCGHFNYNSQDDFTTPTGQVLPLETFPVEYVDKFWKAQDQSIDPCRDPVTTTSICNGTTGNKCHLPPPAIQDYQRACHDFLRQLYPDQPKLVEYYVPPCVADLCLESQPQRDVDYTVPLSAFITEVLKNYKNITEQHYEDLKITPPLMDRRTCSVKDTTSAIPVDEDAAHTTTPKP